MTRYHRATTLASFVASSNRFWAGISTMWKRRGQYGCSTSDFRFGKKINYCTSNTEGWSIQYTVYCINNFRWKWSFIITRWRSMFHRGLIQNLFCFALDIKIFLLLKLFEFALEYFVFLIHGVRNFSWKPNSAKNLCCRPLWLTFVKFLMINLNGTTGEVSEIVILPTFYLLLFCMKQNKMINLPKKPQLLNEKLEEICVKFLYVVIFAHIKRHWKSARSLRMRIEIYL